MMYRRGHCAVAGFCLSLLVAAKVAAGQDVRGGETDCGFRCHLILDEIAEIQAKLAWITQELLGNPDLVDGEPETLTNSIYQPSTHITWSTPSSLPSTLVSQVSSSFSKGDYSASSVYRSAQPTPGPQHSIVISESFVAPEFTPSASEPVVPTQSYTEPSAPSSQPNETMGGGAGYKSVAYFTNWGIYGRQYTPDKVPVKKLTHILYAFADNKDDGTVVLTDTWSDIEKHYPYDSWNDVGKNMYGSLKQLNLAKRQNRNLKILLSIGGWTYTNTQKHFDTPTSTPEGRQRFARSCVDMIKNYGFDGIDLDWEYPQNPGQGEQLLLLIQEIRRAMDSYSDELAQNSTSTSYGRQYPERPHFLISIASSAGKSNYMNLPLDRLGAALDFINLMGYDFSGSWDANAGHQANLYASKDCPTCTPFAIQDVIDDYVRLGVPAQKIVLGMPLYGRAFTNTSGIGQPYNGVGEGSWENGVWDYKALPRPGAVEYYDASAGASYSYDANTKTLISYDTVEMAREKAQYIKERDLGGAMWWELSGDKEDDEGSIITNVVRELGGPNGGRLEQAPNWIVYPDSQYDNLKKGFPNDV